MIAFVRRVYTPHQSEPASERASARCACSMRNCNYMRWTMRCGCDATRCYVSDLCVEKISRITRDQQRRVWDLIGAAHVIDARTSAHRISMSDMPEESLHE